MEDRDDIAASCSSGASEDEREVEDKDDISASSSSGASEDEKEVDDKLSKLNETGGFITSGHHFDIFKHRLGTFLRASSQPAAAHTVTGDGPDPIEDGSLDFNYHTSFATDLISALVEILKKRMEYFAGSELSWWPLANPEYELHVDHVRVYSVAFVSRVLFFPQIHCVLTTRLRNPPTFTMTFPEPSQSPCFQTSQLPGHGGHNLSRDSYVKKLYTYTTGH